MNALRSQPPHEMIQRFDLATLIVAHPEPKRFLLVWFPPDGNGPRIMYEGEEAAPLNELGWQISRESSRCVFYPWECPA